MAKLVDPISILIRELFTLLTFRSKGAPPFCLLKESRGWRGGVWCDLVPWPCLVVSYLTWGVKWVPKSETTYSTLPKSTNERKKHLASFSASRSLNACNKKYELRPSLITNTYLYLFILELPMYRTSMCPVLFSFGLCNSTADGFGIFSLLRNIVHFKQLWTNSKTSHFISFHKDISLTMFSVAPFSLIIIFSLSSFASSDIHLLIVRTPSELLVASVRCSRLFLLSLYFDLI